MWYRWMFLAFITNGLSQFGVRVMKDMGLAASHGHLYLSFWYLTGLIAAAIVFAVNRKRLLWREMVLGSLMGLFSAGCWFLLTGALGQGVPGYLVFPVAIGGSLSVVALVGVVVLKERLSVYGYLGVISGIAAIVLLSTA
ncbi:MAG: hypothetical protein ACYTBZ_23055 [Planctomycetota bacterium]